MSPFGKMTGFPVNWEEGHERQRHRNHPAPGSARENSLSSSGCDQLLSLFERPLAVSASCPLSRPQRILPTELHQNRTDHANLSGHRLAAPAHRRILHGPQTNTLLALLRHGTHPIRTPAVVDCPDL